MRKTKMKIKPLRNHPVALLTASPDRVEDIKGIITDTIATQTGKQANVSLEGVLIRHVVSAAQIARSRAYEGNYWELLRQVGIVNPEELYPQGPTPEQAKEVLSAAYLATKAVDKSIYLTVLPLLRWGS
mgnify:CR=1 FL=1